MEFIMSTDLTTALPKEIGFNFEELKAELAEKLDYYNNLVVTEDTIKEGNETVTMNYSTALKANWKNYES